jgi:hypothetical protein
MSHNIIYITLYLLSITITSGVSFAQWDTNKFIRIEALPKVVKGFPVIIKVIIKGPQIIHGFSIYDNDIPIKVYLISKSDGREYVIKSQRSNHGFFENYILPPLEIPDGKQYTMMFDLWSLSPYLWTDTSLYDIPPAKYKLFLELQLPGSFAANHDNVTKEDLLKINGISNIIETLLHPSKTLKSNIIDIELIEPTKKENDFLRKVIKSCSKYYLSSKEKTDWSEFLQKNINITDEDMQTLSKVSEDQISLHKLISDVNIADEKSRSKSIIDVNNAKLPRFFEPERQLLLLALKGESPEERKYFLIKYPELLLHIDRFDSNEIHFLVGKEIKSLIIEAKKYKPNSSKENRRYHTKSTKNRKAKAIDN